MSNFPLKILTGAHLLLKRGSGAAPFSILTLQKMFKETCTAASGLTHFKITSLLLVSALEFSPKHLPGLLCLTAGAHANSHYCCWSHHFSPYCFDLLLFWVWIWNSLYILLHNDETFCLKGVWQPPLFFPTSYLICTKLIYISQFFIQWPLSPWLFPRF